MTYYDNDITAEQKSMLGIAAQVLHIHVSEIEVDGTTIKHPKTGREWWVEEQK